MLVSEREVVAEVRGLTIRRLRAWVRRGWVRPAVRDHEYRFDELDLARLRLLCELREELGVGEEAVPLLLSLLDQVYGLRRELRRLAEAIQAEPNEVRERILARLRGGL